MLGMHETKVSSRPLVLRADVANAACTDSFTDTSSWRVHRDKRTGITPNCLQDLLLRVILSVQSSVWRPSNFLFTSYSFQFYGKTVLLKLRLTNI